MGTRAPSDGNANEHLTTGSDGLLREHVADIQRGRLIAAMSEIACERGVANTTVAHVVERAGVSRRTFYEAFTDSKECFLATLDDVLGQASDRVLAAYEVVGPWRERIRAALVALLRFLDEEPVRGRLLMVCSLGVSAETEARRSHALDHVVAAVDAGRLEKADQEVTPLTADGLVGGVLSVIHARLFDEDGEPLVNLANPLMAMIVLPYLGRAAARRELAQPAVAKSPPDPTRARPHPLRALPMRLTYRTIRVLNFIASNPGSSNREIGYAADISDQGQISKLLARLQRLGLAQNTEGRPGKGTPNAWTLTATGRDLEQAMSVDTR